MDRIVITGMGVACPLDNKIYKNNKEKLLQGDLEGLWSCIINNESGIRQIENCTISGNAKYCKIAGEIDAEFSPIDQLMSAKDKKNNGKFIHFALVAAHRALSDAKLLTYNSENVLETTLSEQAKTRVGVVFGSGIGGIDETYQASLALSTESRMSPYFVPSCLINLGANMISIKYGFTGPSKSVVTACASSAHAIIDGYLMLQTDQVDYVLCGGSEASICPLGMEGFASMKALCAGFNDSPESGSRPYDTDRSGFVMGEGGGCLILEKESHAKARGAYIYAYVEGFGASADAYHITNPKPEGAALAMSTALKMAKIDEVGHINAHATSTPAGDRSELQALKLVFGNKLSNIPITANKSMLGHLLGGAGVVESVIAILSMKNNIVPATVNFNKMDEQTASLIETTLLISNTSQPLNKTNSNYVLCNSFGFGGTNASVIFKNYE